MNDFNSPRRMTPLHAPAQPMHTAASSLENKDMQVDAAATVPVPEPVTPAEPPHAAAPAEYTISVDQVITRLREQGLSKSKDTIQRWCRSGDLDCQKQGLLNRYFTTEASVLALEKRLLPDMIAEQVGEKNVSVPLHAAEAKAEDTGTKVHAAVPEPARSGMQVQDENNAAAYSDMQEEKPLHAAAPTDIREGRVVELLERQLEKANEEIAFLREEVKDNRQLKQDIRAISDKMLDTFSNVALGGRILKEADETPGKPTADYEQ